jgi:hypothetical protein
MKTPIPEAEESMKVVDLHPSLEEVVNASGLNRTKLSVALRAGIRPVVNAIASATAQESSRNDFELQLKRSAGGEEMKLDYQINGRAPTQGAIYCR